MDDEFLLDRTENVRRRRRPRQTRSCIADWKAVRADALRPSLLTVLPPALHASVRHDNVHCALSAENLGRNVNVDSRMLQITHKLVPEV